MADFVKANRKPLRGGIELFLAVPLGVIFALVGVAGHTYYKWVIMSAIVVLWMGLAYGNSKDPILWTNLIRYLFQQDYYPAHTSEKKMPKKAKKAFNPSGS